MASGLDQLPVALRHQHARGTAVADVRVEAREDSSGEPAVFLVLVLSDPPGGAETWPVDDLWELRRIARQAVSRVAPDLDQPWYVAFEPEHPDEPGPDDLSINVDESVHIKDSVDVAIEPADSDD